MNQSFVKKEEVTISALKLSDPVCSVRNYRVLCCDVIIGNSCFPLRITITLRHLTRSREEWPLHISWVHHDSETVLFICMMKHGNHAPALMCKTWIF